MNEERNTTYANLCTAIKRVLRWKSMKINIYGKNNNKRSQLHNITISEGTRKIRIN